MRSRKVIINSEGEKNMARLQKGSKMPNFKFNTAYKNDIYVNDVLKGKTVFWVLRYIGCTVCRYDVHLISQRYEEFKAKNAQVFVVMQSDQQHVQNDLKETKLPFDIICDNKMEMYHSLEIAPAISTDALLGDKKEELTVKGEKAAKVGFSHGDYEGDELQLPAMFIVDENGIVEYAHYAKSIMDMPTVDEVLKLL